MRVIKNTIGDPASTPSWSEPSHPSIVQDDVAAREAVTVVLTITLADAEALQALTHNATKFTDRDRVVAAYVALQVAKAQHENGLTR